MNVFYQQRLRLVVMGGDSCSGGRGFESRHRILDGFFVTYICCTNCNAVCLKIPKMNDKRGRGWPIFLKKEKLRNLKPFSRKLSNSVTRFGDLLDFGQLLKAFSNN